MTMPDSQFSNLVRQVEDLFKRGEISAASMLLETLKENQNTAQPEQSIIIQRLEHSLKSQPENTTAPAASHGAGPTTLTDDEIGALLTDGRVTEAKAILSETTRAEPSPEKWRLLGMCFKHQGDLVTAEDHYQKSLLLDPNFGPSLNEMFCLLLETNRQAEAAKYLDLMVSRAPNYALGWHYAGLRSLSNGDIDQGISLMTKAMSLDPSNKQMREQLANTLEQNGRLAEAATQYETILEYYPDDVQQYFKIAFCRITLGQPALALPALDRYLEDYPDDRFAILNKGITLRDLDEDEKARAFFLANLQYLQTTAEAFFVLGHVCQKLNQLMVAKGWYAKCLEIDPDHAVARINLAFVNGQLAQLDEAITLTEESVNLDPTDPDSRSNLLFFASYHPDYSPEDIHRQISKWNQMLWEPLRPKGPVFSSDLTENRRLRVGYVSADLHLHVSNNYVFPLMSNHDKSEVEVWIYRFKKHDDEYTERYRGLADHWFEINHLNDEELTNLIRSHQIDVLVDLNGHTVNTKISSFARRAAPVQVTWLGYGNTSGISEMDYFISGKNLVPKDHEKYFSEIVYEMPGTFMCYEPKPDTPEVGPLPFRRNGFITFGSMSRSIRYNEGVRKLWADIVNQVPGSKLQLYTQFLDDDDFAQAIRDKFEASGLDPDRLILRAGRDWWYAYNDVDIALDPFPQNNGGTTFDSLWMGNPMITLAARPPVGRLGTAILTQLGRPDWITYSAEDYLATAVEMANNVDDLEKIRAGLRDEMLASPLCDQKRFAADMEAMYRQAWSAYCKDPKHHVQGAK